MKFVTIYQLTIQIKIEFVLLPHYSCIRLWCW